MAELIERELVGFVFSVPILRVVNGAQSRVQTVFFGVRVIGQSRPPDNAQQNQGGVLRHRIRGILSGSGRVLKAGGQEKASHRQSADFLAHLVVDEDVRLVVIQRKQVPDHRVLADERRQIAASRRRALSAKFSHLGLKHVLVCHVSRTLCNPNLTLKRT